MKNVLFITADQWRGDCLSHLGHRVQTPNLDALASEGVLFKRHYANAVPCGPSRASLHTGQYLQNHRSGTNGTPLDARFTNWALEARAKGHDPVLFGYTDTANDPRQLSPDDPILTSYEGPLPGIKPLLQMGTFPDAWADWLESKGYEIPEPNWRLYTEKLESLEYETGLPHAAALSIPAEDHDTTFMVDAVMDYIKDAEQSFCVHLSLLRPHPPWVAPAPYNSLYDPALLGDFKRADSPEDEASQHPFLREMLANRHYAAPTDDRKTARLKSSYFGLMTEVDTNLGRLFDFLKREGHWDNTLIIFTSDHGEQIGDHHLLGKLGYFDASYHIPLIISAPGLKSSDEPVDGIDLFTENVDIMPTLLDWLGIPIPVQCDGQSLLPLIKTGQPKSYWRSEAHWEYDFRDVVNGESLEQRLGLTPHQCTLNVIRDERYKYVHFTNLPPLFFDLETDPSELRNLADEPEYQALVLRFAQKMLSWRMNHDEQTLTHLALTDDGVVAREAPRYAAHNATA